MSQHLTKTILIGLDINPIPDNCSYGGKIKILGKIFDCQVKSHFPLHCLELLDKIDRKSFFSLFKMTINKDGSEINLSENEYIFFLILIWDIILDYLGKTINSENRKKKRIYGPRVNRIISITISEEFKKSLEIKFS